MVLVTRCMHCRRHSEPSIWLTATTDRTSEQYRGKIQTGCSDLDRRACIKWMERHTCPDDSWITDEPRFARATAHTGTRSFENVLFEKAELLRTQEIGLSILLGHGFEKLSEVKSVTEVSTCIRGSAFLKLNAYVEGVDNIHKEILHDCLCFRRRKKRKIASTIYATKCEFT